MRMRLRQISLVILAIGAIGPLIFFVADRMRCEKQGLTRESALRVASDRLFVHLKGGQLQGALKLTSAEQDDDLSWMVRYQADGCLITIIVDRCGVADIGGLTKGCSS